MNDKEYLITLKVPLSAVDDIDARLALKNIMLSADDAFDLDSYEHGWKLQEVFEDKPPRKIEI